MYADMSRSSTSVQV